MTTVTMALTELADYRTARRPTCARLDARRDRQGQEAAPGAGARPADRLIEELRVELARHGEADVQHETNQAVANLVRFEAGVATPWSASGLAKAIRRVLKECAAGMTTDDARQHRKAGTHWFRHTHTKHALNGRPGEDETVPIQGVQNNLGHASISTTSGYLTTERDARLGAMKGFGEPRRSAT